MKTSNIILAAGILITMGLMTYGMGQAKAKLEESIIKASGNRIERVYDLPSFSKINLRDNVECTLIKSDKQQVTVEMDEAVLDLLQVKVSGEEFLGFDLEGYGDFGLIKVTIHYTDLSQLTVKSAKCSGEIIADSLTHLYVISGSEIDATLKAEYCNVLLQDGSKASLRGTCNSLNAVTESGSNLEADELLVNTCTSVAKSGSRSKVNVSAILYATAESGGNISYLGSPEMKGLVTKSGGTVSKVEEGTSL